MQNFRDLRSKINQHFNAEELRLLTNDLGVDWENLEGSTKQAKAQSLIVYLNRRGRVDDLLHLLQQERPNVAWPRPSAPPTAAPQRATTSAAPSQPRAASQTYHSCFISHASQDAPFAEKLHADLTAAGVQCWYAPEDLPIGAKTRPALDEAVLAQNKLLLILSQHAIASDWVEQEVETAFERERQTGQIILFPIRIDDTVFNLTAGWAAHIKRTRNIGDFRKWQDQTHYQQALARMLRDLQAEEN